LHFAVAAGEAGDLPAKHEAQRGDHQHGAEDDCEEVRGTRGLRAGGGEIPQGEDRGGDAAGGAAEDDAPVDGLVEAVDGRARRLGGGGVEPVGADGRGRVDAEQQDQQRRHQRAATNAREADDKPDDEPRDGVYTFNRKMQMRPAHALFGLRQIQGMGLGWLVLHGAWVGAERAIGANSYPARPLASRLRV